MYNASDLFKKAISQPNRELKIKVIVDGQEYSGSEQIQSCNIEESILDGEDFKFGSANAAAFDLTLINIDESLSAKSFEEKEILIEIGAVLDKFHRPIEYVSMGKFIVDEGKKEDNIIRLTGFDKMIYFEKPYVSQLTYPATLKQILIEICSLAGVELATTSFINDNFVVNVMPDLEGISLRMALEHVSELACTFAQINREGNLELKTLAETPVTIDQSNYFNMNLSEYEYGPIDRVVINNDDLAEVIGEGSKTLEISNNIFALTPNEELLTNIYNTVKNFVFKPFTATWQGNVLTAPGDIIDVSYKRGETYKSFIAKQKFEFGNGLKCFVETNAKTQMQVNYQPQGTITNQLKNVRASIENLGDQLRLEVDEVNNSIAAIDLKADNINISVQELSEKVDEDIQGVYAQIDVSAGEVLIEAKGYTDTVKQNIDTDLFGANSRIDSVEASITTISGQIESKASIEVTDSLGTRVSSAEQNISALDGSISSKVSYTDYNGNEIVSRINQTATTFTIDARNINLDGIARVASTLRLGEPYGDSSEKSLIFRSDAIIYTPRSSSELVIEATMGGIRFNASNINLGGANVSGLYARFG